MTGRRMADDDDEPGRPPGRRPRVAPLVLAAATIALLAGLGQPAAAHLTPNTDISPARNQGICNKGIDIRNNVQHFDRLRGCRVVEGSVQIVLMDKAKDETEDELFRNISFPELREITGYLLLYRANGFRTLSRLFPNLSVIRGNILFFNYALVIYEMRNLHEIGLHSLTHILRGSVYIEKNTNLCYADTIDWDLITKAENVEHIINDNKERNECPGCAEKKCPMSAAKNEPLCWNRQYCQKASSTCPESANCSSKQCNENGVCCHENCIGGCFGEGADKCVACKNVVFNGKCISKCPVGTYEYMNQRCIEEAECRNISISDTPDSITSKSMIPFNNSCTLECPPNHQEMMVEGKKGLAVSTCKPCYGSQCRKECEGINVESIQTAQRLRGCTYIKGGLEITIRGGKNIVRELEENLNSIREIENYLKIVRSFPLVSLNFLRNLTIIHGKKLDQDKYAIVIRDNTNLQELWDWSHGKNLTVSDGRLFFHNNPKLCFNKIVELKDKTNAPDFTDTEVAPDSNGDKIACNVTELKAYVQKYGPEGVILAWESYKHHDPRELLGYVIYYIEAPSKNITFFDGRDACGNDGWMVDDEPPSPDSAQVNHLIGHLKPYTQYAYYIKTYMLSSRHSKAQGAQSPLQYFRTKPAVPSVPRNLKATSNSSSEIVVQWMPPSEPNGNITHYVIEAQLEVQEKSYLEQRDYCKEKIYSVPEKKTTVPQVLNPFTKEDEKSSKSGTCACESKKSHQSADEGEVQYQITFEDYLHNNIYIKRPSTDNRRRRREISSYLSQGQSTFELSKDATRGGEYLFPESSDKGANATPQPPVQPQNVMENDRYIYYRTEVKDTMIVLKQLKHFGAYTISVSACREQVPNETNPQHCSTMSMVNARTNKLDNADNLDASRIFLEVVNATQESNGRVRVKWDEPADPNGIIVAYVLEYRRVDSESVKPFEECISRQDYQTGINSYVIGDAPRSLQPGNYSFRIRATSLVGQGEPSPYKYFVIEKPSSKPSQFFILVIFIIACLFIVAVWLLLQNHRKKTHLANMKIIATVNPEYVSTIYVPDEWEVPRKKIEFIKELGQGSFGMVYEGIVRDIQGKSEAACAVKTAGAQATERERMEFLKEASVMKEFKTHHVVRLLGVVSQGCPELPALVIMELMANGDLKTYLRSHRPDETNNDPNMKPPTLKRTLQMAIEIADGMAYLAFKKFVHRDLAARNCMVAADMTVKIGDFGMTRDIYDTDYYRKDTKGLLPVRWMAPESLKDGIFTSASDVWSYGVVLWEMATLALQPYQGLSNDQVLRYVIDGGMMEPPENCPQRLYDLMKLCWQTKPQKRPTFLELVTRLLADVGPAFAEVSFYHQPDNKELRDTAVALVIAKSRPRSETVLLPTRGDIEDFHLGPDSESEDNEDVGEAAALTAPRNPSPLRSYPALSRSPVEQRPAANNNQGDAKVGNGGGTAANGYLGHHLNHRHNHVNASSSAGEPHKTTEC
ncbi:insulin-like receptor [Neocloeon triangulifer]|nr:insulin-like receptor [Neocloeon triangulifer]XP_059487088.1 insulin-like receptor [Neocloeon triangulifer]